jgi:hypothetical protein
MARLDDVFCEHDNVLLGSFMKAGHSFMLWDFCISVHSEQNMTIQKMVQGLKFVSSIGTK